MGDGHWGCEVDRVLAAWPSVTGQSPCPGALSCVGGRSDARWVGTHSQPHRFHVTSYPSPTVTIPWPPPPPSQPPGPPSQVKSLLCFGVGLSPQCRLMHLDLPWVTTSGRGGTLPSTWPHLPILPIPVSSLFPSSLPSQGDASCVRVSPLVWVSHRPRCPMVDVAPAQGTPPPAAASGPRPSLRVLD